MFYVSHEPRGANINLSVLTEYAKAKGHDIRWVFTKSFNVGQHPREALAVAETFAADFDFEKDVFGVVGGDPIAGVICAMALTHEAAAVGAKSINSFRFVRDRDEEGNRTKDNYVEITIPTGVR